MRVDADVAIRIYDRLLANEPDASADLIELFLDPLVRALRPKYPNLPDPLLINDVVTDSLFKFVQQPQRYQAARGSLWSYLYMDALGDLHNAWESEKRRQASLVPFDPVAHDRSAWNNEVDALIERLAPEHLPAGMTMDAFVDQLRQQLADPRDWEVIELMLAEERRIEAYARVLGIGDQPIADQRRFVKQTKDRLRVWLKRRGVQIHG
jgi:hypothetical protein